jgi:hypothetical protein
MDPIQLKISEIKKISVEEPLGEHIKNSIESTAHVTEDFCTL